MTVSFYLKRPEAKSMTAILIRICYHGHKLKYYSTESINPKYWSKESQRVKKSSEFREHPEFNTRLNNIEATIKNTFRKFQNDHDHAVPDPITFKGLLDKHLRKSEVKTNTFFHLFEDLIQKTKNGTRLDTRSGKPMSNNTIKVYNTSYKHLTNFQKQYKKRIDFDTINVEFYSDYTEYLIRTLKFSTNTIGKHVQVIKLIMNEATEMGLNTNLSYKSKRFLTIREKADSIYLTKEEIQEIEALDLLCNERLDRVRDLFLIGCYTGLRFSDYSILKPSHIKNGFIETTQVKTGDPVVIPIHPTVEKILKKYKGTLPHSISNQKTNDYLKELGKLLPSLAQSTSKSFTKGGVKVVENYKKWEQLTTHTARRSFATNEYLAGMQTVTIMAITSHRSEKSFLKYIKLTPNEHAKLLKAHWEQRNSLKAV
jgi:integrase